MGIKKGCRMGIFTNGRSRLGKRGRSSGRTWKSLGVMVWLGSICRYGNGVVLIICFGLISVLS